MSTVSTVDSRKKTKSATLGGDRKKSKAIELKKSKMTSMGSVKASDSSLEPSIMKYSLDFGELYFPLKLNVLPMFN